MNDDFIRMDLQNNDDIIIRIFFKYLDNWLELKVKQMRRRAKGRCLESFIFGILSSFGEKQVVSYAFNPCYL